MSVIAEIEEMFVKPLGSWPLLLQSIRNSGDLEEVWPLIKHVYYNPVPLPTLVVNSLMALMGLRCQEHYCFVIHSMYVVSEGADPEAINALGRFFTVPIDDSPRWTRIVGLAWLSDGDDKEAQLADHTLKTLVTEEEYAKLKDVMKLANVVMSYVKRDQIPLEKEPALTMIPQHARELMPKFVEFHMQLKGSGQGDQPVCTTCASCNKVRAKADGVWFEREVVEPTLPDNVLYSHGLCEPCAEQMLADIPAA